MATRLFIGNLPDNTAEEDLRSAFSSYGQITNLDLKSKSAAGNEKKFAFVTISGSNYDIETCLKHFSNEDFNGNRLYVTRARESFLERLQRERLEAQQKEAGKDEKQQVAKKTPILKLGEKLNPRKRTFDEPIPQDRRFNLPKTSEKNVQNGDGPDTTRKMPEIENIIHDLEHEDMPIKHHSKQMRHDSFNTRHSHVSGNTNVFQNGDVVVEKRSGNILDMYKKKQDSDHKRMEAMKKKSQEFKQKKMILKSGLTDVDKVPNKKIIFSDNEDDTKAINYEKRLKNNSPELRKTLFDNDDDSGSEVNFEIKKHFEGKKGQKVLDLQSRYKSDKRFVLDERFVEDETEADQEIERDNQIELNQVDEKAKQLNILQDVLGVPLRKKVPEEERDGKKNKPKIGMFRFDPSQPDHAKFLAPVEDTKQESTKKTKKKKDKQPEIEVQEKLKVEEPRPEVSKEQFYKVSDTLKEAIAQPTTFSLRSLFGNAEPSEKESKGEEADYIPLGPPKKPKIKNPLQPGDKNPFVYDSSDSETEDVEMETKTATTALVSESKAVWKESFFFGLTDQRFEEGLSFFTQSNEPEAHKERRELKSLMKKRIYNKERKDQMQMFRKKIGGRKKTMKKSFRRKN